MGRLTALDQRWVRQLTETASTVRLGDAPVWEEFLPQLAEALRARVPMAYGLEHHTSGLRLSFFDYCNGSPPKRDLATKVNEGFASLPNAFAAYSPMRPQTNQRNQAKLLPELLKEGEHPQSIRRLWQYAGIGGHDQLRVLVCEGDTLLAWVGVYRPDDEPFTEREKRILQLATPALRRRLALERQFTRAPLTEAALEACLEAMLRPAMVVDEQGRVQLANNLAKPALRRSPADVEARVKASLLGRSAEFTVTPLKALGLRPHYLTVEATPPRDPSARLDVMGLRWNLTPRERQTLAALVEGLSNKAISVRLQCAERTVEVHVARVLAKAGVGSRAHLISHFWKDGD